MRARQGSRADGRGAASAVRLPHALWKLPETNRLFIVAVAVAVAGLVSGCASRPVAVHHFVPASQEQAAEALDAWKKAVARSEGGPARLLYDARIRQGIGSLSGTLALETTVAMGKAAAGSIAVRATLTGPFGSILAEYSDGALRGEKFEPVAIEPEPLLWLLAGVWKSGPPRVEGIEGDGALLVWDGAIPATGVIRIPEARLTSIRAQRPGGAIEASYGETGDPWPAKVTLTDVRTGNTLRLVLQAREPIR